MVALHEPTRFGHLRSMSLRSPGELLWQERNVRCEVVPLGAGRAVELRSSSGSVFLRKPAPIILDYRLPDVHGRDLCAQFRSDAITAAIPILVVTASPQDSITDCPDAVLSKPCLLPTLLAASRLLLHRALPGSSRGMAAPIS